MVKKGTCSVTQKVRNIEEAGGHVAIIIDDKEEEVQDSFLADDGQSGDISIPAILISKTDGNKLISYYESHKNNKADIKNIKFEIKFDLEKTDNTVKYDIWYTPDQENVYTFLKDFQRYQKALGDAAILGVHFVTYPHFLYDPNSNNPKDDCLGSGLYCIRPGKLGISDGSLIVLESIKQKCIYNYAYSKASKSVQKDLFWKFMIKFHDKCIADSNFGQVCSNNVADDVGLPIKLINECLQNSFEGSSYDREQLQYQKILKNYILDKEYELRKQYYITRVPSITINGRLYIGTWKPEYVFEALCASLIRKPEACYSEGSFQREEGFSAFSVILIISVVIAINVILFLVCKTFIRKRIQERINSTDINSKIDTVVNSYLALRDTK